VEIRIEQFLHPPIDDLLPSLLSGVDKLPDAFRSACELIELRAVQLLPCFERLADAGFKIYRNEKQRFSKVIYT
jgi:hypothetical protein